MRLDVLSHKVIMRTTWDGVAYFKTKTQWWFINKSIGMKISIQTQSKRRTCEVSSLIRDTRFPCINTIPIRLLSCNFMVRKTFSHRHSVIFTSVCRTGARAAELIERARYVKRARGFMCVVVSDHPFRMLLERFDGHLERRGILILKWLFRQKAWLLFIVLK